MKTIGYRTWHLGSWRIQAYWPTVTIDRTELHFGVDTAIRIANRTDSKGRYAGAGFAFLGFGIGVAYMKRAESN